MNFRFLSFLLLLPSLAHAHPGHSSPDFTGGLVHPVLGIDHVLAMLAVGLWAAQLGGTSRWKLPVSFVVATGLSLALGAAGWSLPWTEACIAISVLLLGSLIAAKAPIRPTAAAALAAGCAFFHGLAHASELPTAGSVQFAMGILVSTALLHLGGLIAGSLLISTGRSRWVQGIGAAVSAAAIWLTIA
jgi:urease accessory protein